MSMNLHAKEVELWQTPTWITEICYSNGDGGWKGILHRYKIWVKSMNQKKCKDPKEFEQMQESVRIHLECIDSAVKKYKKLSFYVI